MKLYKCKKCGNKVSISYIDADGVCNNCKKEDINFSKKEQGGN